MTKTPWRIYGAEMSPYSVKVRGYLRYKSIPHEWIVRTLARLPEFERHAKLPLIPLVVSPEGEVMQDSTPIIEALEARFPENSIHPPDAVADFASWLLEEFADEWGNKWMFHLRWARPVDQHAAAVRIARTLEPDADEAALEARAETVRHRMVARVGFVGSSPENAPLIEASFVDTLRLLDRHLEGRAYLFGERPALADFGLWGQVQTAWTDPTGYGLVVAHGGRVIDWLHRMAWPHANGDFESWSSLAPTLDPLLRSQVCRRFLPWTQANERAVADGAERFTVEIDGHPWTQRPQRYHARSLASLRQRLATFRDRDQIHEMLAAAGCDQFLRTTP
ncbi:MAG: glutathione S-transferase family protein [Burkholderiaceae bacterium]|nr:glutathione S-transferase family protein [Burkholderiaceae bacterium]